MVIKEFVVNRSEIIHGVMSNYRQLDVWRDGCFFARDIYLITNRFKDYGLRNQLCRAAVSISSNIAEGSNRGTDKEYARFIKIAKASCEECRTQLYIAKLIEYLDEDEFCELDARAKSIGNRLGALAKYLDSNPSP